MTLSIDFNSPVIRILGLETKYDFAGASNSFIRVFADYLPARIVQQFHFWLGLKKGGFVIDGEKWIYKSQLNLRTEAIAGFSEYRVRKAIKFLVANQILIRKQLHRQHKGGKHAYAAYNRQYYYRIDYDALTRFIKRQVKKLRLQIQAVQPTKTKLSEPPLVDGTLELDSDESMAEAIEMVGFVKVANQISDLHEPDSRISPNTTDTTIRIDHSNTPPLTPPMGEGKGTQPQNLSTTPEGLTKDQEKGNLQNHSQKKANLQTTPFNTVVERPRCVEQKINKMKVVQKPVQPSNVPESVQVEVEVMPPEHRKRSPKTPRGTKPNNDFGLAPWKSLEQFGQFYRALVKKLPIVANSRSPQGLAHKIINQLKKGVPHSYWDDFINGLPIGTSTQQEWEVEPGVAHPMFIEYLTEKLIKGNNTQTREQAVANALNIVSSPKQAIFFWKECKISLGNALHEAERHRAMGVNALSTPLWTKERPEPTLEEAAEAGTKIALINSAECANRQALLSQSSEPVGSTKAVIEATQNRQIEGSTGQIEPNPHKQSNTPLELDPWLESEKPPKKPKLSDYASDSLKRFLNHGGGKTQAKSNRAKSARRYHQPDNWRTSPLKISEMSFSSINKALQDPILRDRLAPQLMLSDYELITDEGGRIIRIEDKPI